MDRVEMVKAFLAGPADAPLAPDVTFTRIRSVASGREAVLQ